MFGYIRVYKPELKMGEYSAYNAVYCGFCRALGSFGSILRMTLSYDFTFFSLLSLSLDEDFCGFTSCRCPAKLFSKKTCVKECEHLTYSARLAIMMLYFKLLDDKKDRDKFSPLKALALLYLKPRYKKVAAALPKEAGLIENFIKEQERVEDGAHGIDACCDPTARVLSQFFALLSKTDEQKEALSRLGYVLGRWIYLLDAADDLEKDIKKRRFNPLKTGADMSKDQIADAKKEAEFSLNVCISEAQDAILKLKLYHFEPVLKNVIFLGLKNTQDAVLYITDKKERRLALNGSVQDFRSK